MADVAIVSSDVASAPKDYLIPAGQEILLKQVKASFDCTGAAGTVQPAVQLLAASGTVMGTWTDPNVTIAVGGTADCTWFPGVRPAAAAASTSGLASAAGTVTGGITVLAGGVGTIAWDAVNTSGSEFSWSSGTPRSVTVATGGMYMSVAWVTSGADWPDGTAGEFIYLYVPNSGAATSYSIGGVDGAHPWTDLYTTLSGTDPVVVVNLSILAAGATWELQVSNSSSSSFGVAEAEFMLFYVGDSITMPV